jgi:hypothetical protein
MITPVTIQNLDNINNLLLSFNSTVITIGASAPAIASATVYINGVIKELALDALQRDGT